MNTSHIRSFGLCSHYFLYSFHEIFARERKKKKQHFHRELPRDEEMENTVMSRKTILLLYGNY